MHRQPSTVLPPRLPVAQAPCPVVPEFPPRCGIWNLPEGRAALALLFEAHSYARELDRSAWDFAVEIAALHEAGLTASTLRWLVCKGYVEHAHELTGQGRATRSFRRSVGLRFDRQTCFVLTESGVAFAQDVLARSLPAGSGQESLAPGNGDGSAPLLRPVWDVQQRQLRVGQVVVKHFKVPAGNQKAILAAFEEEGWPPRIDDPLIPQPEQDPKRRLHDTINALNRNQRHPLLRFTGDGSGEGVCWSLVRPDENGGTAGGAHR